MVHKPCMSGVHQGQSSGLGMCHPSLLQKKDALCTKDMDSDDSLKWEDFFGASVDITSALLDMYDTLVAKNKINEGLNENIKITQYPCSAVQDEGFISCDGQVKSRLAPTINRNQFSKRSFSDRNYFKDKKRPLSTSSVSSSSSSSTSSLPRNGLDVKKSYLASIESLDDDEFCDDSGVISEARHYRDRPFVARDRDSVDSLSECGYQNYVGNRSSMSPPGKPRWCDPNLSHTDKVLIEIVETERTYVRDLNEIIQGYMKYISNSDDMNAKVSPKNLQELFSNIEDIYIFNSVFLEELECCGLNPVAVAKCFVKNSCGFTVYTQYCTNYPRTVSVLTELMRNSETAEIFKERQTSLQHSLPLGSYLLKPVQRILKYHLLLQNIVKHSDKESDGYPDVKNALSVMTGIAHHINEMKRKHEHAVRVQEIQSLLYSWEGQDLTTYGELVAEGAFRMFHAKALRHLFLFDKMLLIAKKKEEGILSYKAHIMCSNLMLIESIQGEPLCFHVIPFDNPRYQYTFQTRNLAQKREWCLQLKRVILENYNAVIPSHARQLVMELGQNKQDDTGPTEKSTTKRLLSAPEYLERRKQERRKSEISLNKAFRLKKGMKKSPAPDRRGRTSASACKSPTTPTDSPKTPDEKTCNNTSSLEHSPSKDEIAADHISSSQVLQDVDMEQDSSQEKGHLPLSPSSSVGSDSHANRVENSKGRHLGKNANGFHNQRLSLRERHLRAPWNSWKNPPEETTDTENEDGVDVQKLLEFRPPHRASRTKAHREINNPSGEYVTFFFAQACARKAMEQDQISSDVTDNSVDTNKTLTESKTTIKSNTTPGNKNDSVESIDDQEKDKKCHQGNYDSDTSPSIKSEVTDNNERIDHGKISSDSSSSNVSLSLWKQNAALRRVQSFTGMAKAKVASLHHSLSFRQSNAASPEPKGSAKSPESVLPTYAEEEDNSPTKPATWLQLQEEHLASGTQKCGSLPRSFQLGQETDCSKTDDSIDSSAPGPHKLRTRLHTEQRPFTIASDKPTQADFTDDYEHYMNVSPSGDQPYNFPARKEHFDEPETTTTGCTNTPAVSLENVHSIHPDHKIYHQAASKYATLKHVLSTMGSKLASLKMSFSPHIPEHTDSCSNISMESEPPISDHMFSRSSSRASIKSEKDINTKLFTARLVHSFAKAYSSVVKQKLKKNSSLKDLHKKSSPSASKTNIPPYKPDSSIIGARIASPYESEYSVPKNCIPSRQNRTVKDDEARPDSLFSESSNATSSSDGDKGPEISISCISEMGHNIDLDDTQSEASESSADSYYERTFEAIENALAEDMFRDSAIYSDPEDADLSAAEYPTIKRNDGSNKRRNSFQNSRSHSKDSPTSADLVCVRKVDRAIIDRLRILEENLKFQKEDFLSVPSIGKKKHTKHSVDTESSSLQGSSQECIESETSSEHSASTVNTVMETADAKNAICISTGLNKNQSTRIKGWVKHVVDKFQGESQA